MQARRWFERLRIKRDSGGGSRLYLYTTETVDFYARLGWTALDRTKWKGFDTTLMVRDLSEDGADKERAA